MQEAKDKVNIELDYDRPPFIFPNLSSEKGNPIEYFKMAQQCLRKFGFNKESDELGNFRHSKYNEHFNIISRFLDFTNSQVSSEDENYIYVKIKKNSYTTEQPRIFLQNSVKDIRTLISDNHDFSLLNCYGRNQIYYIETLPAIQELIEHNKEKKWFDIFSLDKFNSTILHGNRSFPVFAYILNEMFLESKEMTKMFLYGTNVFNNNAFGEFLLKCDIMFQSKNSFPSLEKIKELSEVLKIIGKIDPQKKDEFISLFKELEKTNSNFNSSEFKTIIFQSILESELSNSNSNIIKKMKI